ncbi:MAG TPA: FG-GAP-like repeat-containing protein [Terriglobia bacterium]
MSSDGSQPAFRIESLFLVCAALALAPSTLQAQTYVFGRADLVSGLGPAAVVTGDFNGDGQPDLAVVNENDLCEFGTNCPPGSISIFLGQPDGTFSAPIDTTVGVFPTGLTVGDFNGDGRLDVAVIYSPVPSVGTGSNVISVLLGNGDGTFQSPVTYTSGGEASSIVTADFNGDGKLDLAVANGLEGTVSILVGNGDGTFQAHFDYPANGASALTAGDFNGDGKPDLATTTSWNNAMVVNVLINNGDGTFKSPVTYTIGGIGAGIATADLNGDGRLDLVVSIGGSIAVLLGNGDGTFQAPVDYPAGTTSSGLPVIADFNGDGKLDVALPSDLGISVLPGNGDGTFQAALNYNGLYNVMISAGDYNGDGKLDLAAVTTTATAVLIGHGDGTFATSPTSYPIASSDAPGQVVVADFNGDGKLDFAATSNLVVSVLLGNGDGTFQPHLDLNTGSQAGALAAADFNGDGKPDLAVLHQLDNTVAIFLGNGDGTFQTGATYATGTSPVFVATGDFNGDGKPDLAVANVSGNTVSILLGNGDGTFKPQVAYASGGTPLSIVVGDFDSDGKLDLAVATNATVSVLLGNGDGTFQAQVAYPALGLAISVVTGDFNRDGKLDLVVGNEGSGAILLGNGDGTFQPAKTINSVVGFGLLATADVNGDGKLDLAVGGQANPAGDFVLLGNGDGTFQSPAGVPFIYSGAPLVAGDFNGDGALDLASLSTTSSVDVILNAPVIGLSPSSINFSGQGVGTSGSSQTLLVSNPGSMAFDISGIAVSGAGFAETNTCGASLATGANCEVSVTFTPSSTGTATGALTLTDSVPGSPQTIALTGTGVNGPYAELSTTSLDFGYQSFYGPGATKTVTLTNSGNATLSVTSVSISGSGAGAYYQTNACVTLAAGSSCTLTVTFPIGPASGLQIASLSIYDNASNSPQVVSLSGTAANPVLVFSPTSLTFPTENVGVTSSPQTLTLTNTANVSASFLVVGLAGANAGDFGESSTCQSLAAGASCTVTVTFTPTAPGTRTASVCVTDDPAGSCVSAPVVSAALSGTGGPAPVVSFSPPSLTFAAQQVGSASPIQTLTLTNTGSAALTITSVTTSGDFTAINACSGSVAAGASCRINVIFKPTAAGARTGTVAITDNAAGSPQQVALSGTGTVPEAALSPSSLSFGSLIVGQSSAFGTVTLSNAGTAALTIAGISFSGANAGDFAQGLAAPPPPNLCGKTLAAGSSCDIFVVFKPTAGGSRSATLTVSDNAPGGSQSISLSGTGQDFSLGVSGSSTATIAAGQSATYRVQVNSQSGFTGNVSLACSGAPSASTCAVGILTPVGSGPLAADIIVTTTARSSVLNRRHRIRRLPPGHDLPRAVWPLSPGGLAAIGLALAALAGLFDLGGRRRRRSAAMLLVCIALVAAMTLVISGCGGGGSTMMTTSSGTPAGTYTITVTGTFTSGSVNLQHSTNLTLVVQ